MPSADFSGWGINTVKFCDILPAVLTFFLSPSVNVKFGVADFGSIGPSFLPEKTKQENPGPLVPWIWLLNVASYVNYKHMYSDYVL